MLMRCLYLIIFICVCATRAHAQKDKPAVDTSFADYDALFDELDGFLDSLMQPRSFAIINAGLTSNYFNYEKSDFEVVSKRKFVLAPSVSYFHKSGLGLSAAASVIKDSGRLNPYQFTGTASYDYLANRRFLTGISYSRFFTKENLGFYTSPLQNQLFAYFTYRKFRLRPSVAASYGWGSRTALSQQEEYIRSIRLRPRGYTKISTTETVNDFSLTGSLRYDFYWLNVLGDRDFIRITPQISFMSGTQKFGFNQNSNTYATVRGTGTNVLYQSENINLDDQLYFQPLSLTAFLKTEYATGRFYIQPQLMFDYYFPATNNNFITIFLLNTGFIF